MTMPLERFGVISLLVLSSFGCREPRMLDLASRRCADPDAACVELGIGPDVSPIADGAEIELVHGPQGGWHVELGVRFTDIDPSGATLVYEAHNDDGERLSRMRYGITPRRLVVDGHHQVRPDDLVIFDIDSGDRVRDRVVTFEVRLEDETGVEISSDVRTLRVVDLQP
jgi:hypothetical protein